MIDEFFFDNQAQTLVELWSEIENLLIQEICRRINKAAYLTEQHDLKLISLNRQICSTKELCRSSARIRAYLRKEYEISSQTQD